MMRKEKLEKHLLEEDQRIKQGNATSCPVLSKEVDQEIEHQIKIMAALRSGKTIQYRTRCSSITEQWRPYSLNLNDPIGNCRLDFYKYEYRLPPEEKEVTVWATVTVSGNLHGMWMNKQDANKAARRCSRPMRVIPLTAKVEVLG